MSDAGISSIILVIVSLIVATIIGGVFIQISDDLSLQIQEDSENTAREISADVRVVSAPQFVFEGDEISNTTTIYVKNTGEETIEIGTDSNGDYTEIDTFINGRFVQPDSATVIEGDSNIWSPSDTVRLEYQDSSDINCFEDNLFSLNTVGNDDSLTFFADCA